MQQERKSAIGRDELLERERIRVEGVTRKDEGAERVELTSMRDDEICFPHTFLHSILEGKGLDLKPPRCILY